MNKAYAFLMVDKSAPRPLTYFSGLNYKGPYYLKDKERLGNKLLFSLDEVLKQDHLTETARKRFQGLTQGHGVVLTQSLSRSNDFYLYCLTDEEQEFLAEYQAALDNVVAIQNEIKKCIPDDLNNQLKIAEKNVRALKRAIDEKTFKP